MTDSFGLILRENALDFMFDRIQNLQLPQNPLSTDQLFYLKLSVGLLNC